MFTFYWREPWKTLFVVWWFLLTVLSFHSFYRKTYTQIYHVYFTFVLTTHRFRVCLCHCVSSRLRKRERTRCSERERANQAAVNVVGFGRFLPFFFCAAAATARSLLLSVLSFKVFSCCSVRRWRVCIKWDISRFCTLFYHSFSSPSSYNFCSEYISLISFCVIVYGWLFIKHSATLSRSHYLPLSRSLQYIKNLCAR